jgi:hypothetical protein
VLVTITIRQFETPDLPIAQDPTDLVEQALQNLLLTDLEGTADNSRVVDTQDRIDIVHALRPHVGQLLDLGGSILDLVVGHVQLQLLSSRLDAVECGGE